MKTFLPASILNLKSRFNNQHFVFSFIFLLLFSYTGNAQTNCGSSLPISINGTCVTASTNVNDNSVEVLPAVSGCSISTPVTRERWYTFNVTTGPITVTISATVTNRNLFLQLVSSSDNTCGGTLSQIACANATNSSGAQTENIVTSLPNGTYYIRILNIGTGINAGNMNLSNLCVTSPVIPANNECATPTSLTVNPSSTCTTSTNGTTILATQSQVACAGTADDDVWYSFVATGTTHTVTVTPTTLSDAVLEVFSGSCGTLVSLDCENSTIGSAIETTTLTGLTSGFTYFVRVYSSANGTGQGTFSVCVSTPVNPCISTTNIASCGATTNTTFASGVGFYGGTSSCGFTTLGAEKIFTFTPTTTDTYTIQQLSSFGTIDYQFKPFSSGCNSTGWTCIDDLNGAAISAGFALTAGVQYYILLDAESILGGNVSFTVRCPIPPNTLCSTATTLPCATSNLAGTTVGTSNTAHGTTCTISNYGVWYTFVGDGNQSTISSTATFDHEMSISSGSCGSFTNISCNDSALTGGTETASFVTTIGVNYYVYIAHWDSLSTTTGTFTISRTCTIPFNPCASIPNITGCGIPTNATITAGTGAYGTSACGFTTPGNEQLYTFTPTITGNYSIQQLSSFGFIDYQFKLSSGGCNSSGWSCIDDLNGASVSANFALTAGNQYYILLDPESSTGGSLSFSITCPIGPITNNDCSVATALTVNPSTSCTISLAATTIGATQSQTGCFGTADDDVWFSFVATTSSHGVTVSPNGLSDAVLQVFSGSCGSLTSLDCVDDTISSNESTILTGLTIGNTYFVRVYSYSNGSGQGNFNICITSYVPCSSGPGTGTTTIQCPYVEAGGLGLLGVDHAPIDACASSTCVDLEATYLRINETTSYNVDSITYNPPYQFDCLQNAVSVNVDDVWSPTVTLPFNFCFYGNNYNQCLISSNGTITFDLVNNTPSGSSTWSFSNNIPSNTLFLNTIFGVYHDIDPSKGGTVGWELVTVNNGCRALVAAWDNIPMFSFACNSQLYTGMIVLYENTNIIEVYIEEKNVCSTWNSGNALVGIQNATGTLATVAPGRNSADADWTVTNEAWRFTPSGVSVTSLKWYEGAGVTGPVIGTSNTINVCPASTTTYTAETTYTMCDGTTVKKTEQTTVTISNSKVWNGNISTDWNNPLNWTPNTSIPTSADCVIIPNRTNDPIVSGSGYNALGSTLSILTGGVLTINSGSNITITNWVNVNATGTFLLNNSSNLVQINNVANTGNITYKRDASIRTSDYVYWSSPVANFNVSNIASPIVLGPTYTWDADLANPNGGQGYWINAAGNNMSNGIGYIVRGPISAPFNDSTNSILNGSFNGIPNNGNITTTIYRGNDQNTATHYGANGTEVTNLSDNFNLLGNPYPSAIRASQFLFNNNTKIEGSVSLWTHGTLPANIASPFYATYVYNYTPNDYLTYNFTGTSCCPLAPADLFIGAAQGFFVIMKDGPQGSDVVNFNNGLRNATYDNTVFYKNNPTVNATENLTEVDVDIERNRIWIDILDATNFSNRTLVGYIEGATMDADSFFDLKTAVSGSGYMAVYSLIGDLKYGIQGRSLPFDINDEIPIGVNIPAAGAYTIAIGAVDGLFNNQNIYLKDTLLNIIYDIKTSPYQFTSDAGTYDNRFKIVYLNGTLSNANYSLNNDVKVVTNEKIIIHSNNESIKSIVVFDVLGRKLAEYNNVNSQDFVISNLIKNNSTLLLNITVENGSLVTKKIIY